jgi:phage terminase large subunit-like protein
MRKSLTNKNRTQQKLRKNWSAQTADWNWCALQLPNRLFGGILHEVAARQYNKAIPPLYTTRTCSPS